MKTRKGEKLILGGILALSLVSRVGYQAVNRERMDQLVISDMRTYDLLAVNLIEKGYYGIEAPWSYRPPLYPVFLSLVYRIFGHSYPIARTAQAVLAAGAVLLVFHLARELIGSSGALLAALLTAIDLSLIHLSGLFLSENLYLPLSLALLLLLIRGFRNPATLIFISAGVLGGLAALCRPTVLSFLFLSGLVPFLKGSCFDPSAPGRRPSKRNTVKGVAGWAVMLAAAGITISPWAFRNWRLHHAFVPVSTNAGTMLWMGLHNGAPGDYHFPEENNPLFHINDEVERNRRGIEESVLFIREHPGQFFHLVGTKFFQFWELYPLSASGKQGALFLVLGAAGFLISLGRWRRWVIIYLYFFSFMGVHLLVHSGYRYRWPLHPLVGIWAAFICIRFWEKLKNLSPRREIVRRKLEEK